MKLSYNQLSSLLSITGKSSNGKYVYAICPMCGENEFYLLLQEDNHPSACNRKNKCGAHFNIFTLLKYLGRTKEFVSEFDFDVQEKLVGDLEISNPSLDLSLEEIQPPMLWRRAYDDEYLRERGFTDEQFEKYHVGTSLIHKDYVTILIYQNHKLTGYISRSKKSKEWIDNFNKKNKDNKQVYLRYNNSKTDFAKMLFGLDEIVEGKTTDVILVEGLFSKTKTDVNLSLYEIDEIKCCATFGAKLSIYQIELLKRKGVKNIWLWFESDVLEIVKDIAATASLYFNIKVGYLNGKDPNDLNRDETLELMDNSVGYLEFNMTHLHSNLE